MPSAFSVPSYQAGLDFYVGVLGFCVLEDHWISADKRWLVIAPSIDCAAKIILAKATTYAQISAIGHQTGDRVGFSLHTDDFSSAYLAMQTAGVTFEELPRDEPYG